MNEFVCMKCKKELIADEMALHKKLFGRQATSYWCLDCQAEYLGSTREHLQKLIDYYRESGTCILFSNR